MKPAEAVPEPTDEAIPTSRANTALLAFMTDSRAKDAKKRGSLIILSACYVMKRELGALFALEKKN